MKTKKLTNEQKIDLILNDLENWIQAGGGESDDSMVYAFNNNYLLHAASLWLGTGAMSSDVERKVQGVKINRRAEMREINLICKHAFIYICPSCNHHGFHDDDQGSEITCFSCGKSAPLSRDSGAGKPNIRCYDNGGKTLDRYTVIYLDQPESTEGTYGARGMNAQPFHGIGLYCSAVPGRHLGKRIQFSELPEDCRKLVLQDLEGES